MLGDGTSYFYQQSDWSSTYVYPSYYIDEDTSLESLGKDPEMRERDIKKMEEAIIRAIRQKYELRYNLLEERIGYVGHRICNDYDRMSKSNHLGDVRPYRLKYEAFCNLIKEKKIKGLNVLWFALQACEYLSTTFLIMALENADLSHKDFHKLIDRIHDQIEIHREKYPYLERCTKVNIDLRAKLKDHLKIIEEYMDEVEK